MKADLKQAFETEMATAYGLFRNGSLDEAFVHLEHAHVLGQRDVAPHVRSHWLMLRIGLARRAPTEVWGQALRILLGALGSAVGVVPAGNTGGTNISMFKRLPIAPEVQKTIEGK
ncbi:MAG TPA: DUF3703 domain-containing protein [Noviherbaspirillum sp.]|nr:DUF3703 domain-containing protein [Noviherbaspirillum sp.]